MVIFSVIKRPKFSSSELLEKGVLCFEALFLLKNRGLLNAFEPVWVYSRYDDFPSDLAQLRDKPELFYFRQGLEHCKTQKYYRKAEQDFSTFISLNSNIIFAYFLRGILRSILEDKAGALDDFSRVNDFSIESDHEFLVLGISKLYSGFYSECIDVLSALILRRFNDENDGFYDNEDDYWGDDKDAYFYRGIAKYKLGNYKSALSDFEKADSSFHSTMYKGLCNYWLENFSLSFEEFDKLNFFDEPDIPLLLCILTYHLREREQERAIKRYFSEFVNSFRALWKWSDYKSIISRQKFKSFLLEWRYLIYYNEALYFLGKKSHEEALKSINKAMKANDKDLDSLLVRSIIELSAGKYQDAAKDLDYLIAMGFESPETYLNRGIVAKLLDDSEAKFYFSKAISLNSKIEKLLLSLENPEFIIDTFLGEKFLGWHRIVISLKQIIVYEPLYLEEEVLLRYIRSLLKGKLNLAITSINAPDVNIKVINSEGLELSNNNTYFFDLDIEPWFSTDIFFKLFSNDGGETQLKIYHPDKFARVQEVEVEELFETICNHEAVNTSNLANDFVIMSQPQLNLDDLYDKQIQVVFTHIDIHGSITEDELIHILGSPRKVRRFSNHFDEYSKKLPFKVLIEVTSSGKRYVKQN